jgi:hypothetical protein
VFAIWLAPLLCWACSTPVSPERALVNRYTEGIQSLHEPTYRDLFLACHPEAEPKSLSERMAAYEVARRSGKVGFSPDGVEIIKLTALGRGTFYRVHAAEATGDRLRFGMTVLPEYGSINFDQFPPGAILYILAEPLGTVFPLRPGGTEGPERRVLRSMDLEWTWVRPSPGSPERCLESLLPDIGSAEFMEVRFRESPVPPGIPIPTP